MNLKAINRGLILLSFLLASSGIVLMLLYPLTIVLADLGKVLVCCAICVFLLGLIVGAFVPPAKGDSV